MDLVPNEGTDLPWVKSKSMQEKDHPWHGTKCFSPLGRHAPSNFLLSKLILLCASRTSCCRVVKACTRIFRNRGSNLYPSFNEQSLHARLKYELHGLDPHLSFNELLPVLLVRKQDILGICCPMCCLIHSQWDWKCLMRIFSLSEPLAHGERCRWQENPPPTFRFAHLSTLLSHADWALPFSAVQDISSWPLNSILSISKYTNVFQSLEGETHGNFRFSLKLITNKCCWADEILQAGSATACPAPGLPCV